MEKVKATKEATYDKWDDKCYRLYFNREEVTMPLMEGQEEPQVEYEYETCLADGVTDADGVLRPDRGSFVNAIIRSRYSLSDELAIQRHQRNDADAYRDEWDEYDAWCEKAKEIVRSYNI